MRNNSCRQLLFDLFQMLKWRTKQEQSQTCLSYALQGGIRRIQNGGTKGQWDKGTFVFSIFQFGQKRPIKIIIYIINIYINNIYNNSYKNICRPTTLISDNAKTICPNVPMSQCPIFFVLP